MEMKIEKENVEYAKILLQDFSGDKSEETSFHNYLYQSIILDGELSNFFNKLAVAKMKNLQTIGKLIFLLGYQPGFYTVDSNIDYIIPWNSNNVDYNMDISNIILGNISGEMNSIKRYEKHINEIDDVYIKKILEKIIEENEANISNLRKIYHKYLGKIC